ncbi:hypothetical protein KAI12_05425 [Candidatus Bathyarchaeota archaeon]|nr:hypothetical protein [Candidatus Bathyarchaeota archaeon]
MIRNRKNKTRRSIPVFMAFIPFGILLIQNFYPVMSLKWALLVASLESIAIVTIFTNVAANDPVWALFGVWAFIVVCRPVYFALRRAKSENLKPKSLDKLTFGNLFKLCSGAVFADYRITLLAAIPLVVQALIGGSIIYTIYGGDWVMHTLAGFGVGAMAFLAYRTSLNKYGYTRLYSYFHLDKIRFPKIERKTGALEFVIFSIIIVAVIWEALELSIILVSPENVLRVHMETLFNRFADISVAIFGAIFAWYLIKYKLKWF